MNTFSRLSPARVANVSRRSAKQAMIALVGASALSLFAVAASAMPQYAPQVRVDFEDLNLSKSADTQRLYRRLRAASAAVCRDYTNYAGEHVREMHRDCMRSALANAIATIGHPALTDLHATKRDVKVAQRKSEGPTRS